MVRSIARASVKTGQKQVLARGFELFRATSSFEDQMNNRFFQLALSAAARMVGNPSRLILLAARATVALRRVDVRNLTQAREQLAQVGRLVRAYAQGQYRKIPAKPLLAVTAALVYFLNPLDLVPDALPALGLTDDFAVLTWVYQSMSTEMGAFLEWEKRQ